MLFLDGRGLLIIQLYNLFELNPYMVENEVEANMNHVKLHVSAVV